MANAIDNVLLAELTSTSPLGDSLRSGMRDFMRHRPYGKDTLSMGDITDTAIDFAPIVGSARGFDEAESPGMKAFEAAMLGLDVTPAAPFAKAIGAAAPLMMAMTKRADVPNSLLHPRSDTPNVIGDDEVIIDVPISAIEHGESALPGGKLTDPGSEELIDTYAKADSDFPPISLMKGEEGDDFGWMVEDGSHRLEAAKLRGDTTIPAAVMKSDAPLPMGDPIRREIRPSDVETGKPIQFFATRNTEKSPNFGSRFGQDVEPAGRYMSAISESNKANLPNHQYGMQEFNKPLVVEFGGGYEDASNWKQVLSKKYGGLTGMDLNNAIRQDGYDGIVTVSKSKNDEYVSEILDLDLNRGFMDEASRMAMTKRADVPAGVKGDISWDVNTDPVAVRDEMGDLDYIDGPEYALIETVSVPKSERGKGHATQLMGGALRDINKLHPGMDVRLAATPLDESTDADRLVSFYEKLGFTADDYVEGMDGIPMTLDAGALDSWVKRTQSQPSLPMDEASRMARAREMGFDVDTPLYHGSSKGGYNDTHDIEAFDYDKAGDKWGQDEGTFFFSDNPEEANYYATTDNLGRSVEGAVYPTYQRSGNPMVIDSIDDLDLAGEGSVGYWDARHKELVEAAKAGDHDAIRLIDRGAYEDQKDIMHVALDPKNIRSRFAAFDPAKKDSSDLLATLAAMGVIPATYAATRNNREEEDLLGM